MSSRWHGPDWRSERRRSLHRGLSVGEVKRPVPSPDPAPRDDDDDDEETLTPGAYAVMRDTSASDTLFLEDLEDPDDRSFLAVVDNNSVFEDDNYDDGTGQDDDDERSKKEKSCITSKSRIIVILFLVCCAIACCTILVDVFLLLQGRKTKTVPTVSDTSICDASPTDPFVHCSDCGPRIAEISAGLRSVYDLVKNSAELRDHFLQDKIDIHSCSPVNKALIWVALQVDDKTGLLPPERIINRFVLVLLYASTGGKYWTKQDKWLSGAHECDWDGILCDSPRRRINSIISIHLPDNGLYLTLESSRLGLLTNLRSIDFTNNDIQGSIPSSIFRLSALEEFLVGQNNLEGTMPSILQVNGTKLRRIDVSRNLFLTGALPNLSGLAKLTELRLGSTDMTGTFPLESLDKLTRLEVLDLKNLKDSQQNLLSSLSSLTNLRILHVARTHLFGTIPAALGDLVSLEYLWMTASELTGTIPTTLGFLTNLTYLGIDNNFLEGSLPSELGSISQMEELLVSRNEKLEGTIPTELAKCTRLSQFRASTTSLTGTIPESFFGNLTKLREVKIECTNIQLPPILSSDGLCNTTSASSITIYTTASCSCCEPGTALKCV